METEFPYCRIFKLAKKSKILKPIKKTTEELFSAIHNALLKGEYYFTDHGESRSKTRKNVNVLEVLKILGGHDKWHENIKDKYENNKKDWNYHIRGKNSDGEQIRIAVSFDKDGMPIITVINLDEVEND
jgi:hypothetical protein